MCVAGARWAQKDVLEKHPDPKLRVYAVWFSMVKTDDRDGWPQGVLTDPRVTHLWDEGKVVGNWYAAQHGEPGQTLWDAFLLYPADARFKEDALKPVTWGAPIVKEREKLEAELPKLLAATSNPS